MYLILDSNNNIEKIVSSLDMEDLTNKTYVVREVPEDYPEAVGWNSSTLLFEEKPSEPIKLDGLGILNLYTAEQHARAARMLFATYPAGHIWEGQLVDPQALTQRLIDATLALKTPISVASEFHINGTMWMRGIGVLESDLERDRVLAGIPPNASQ